MKIAIIGAGLSGLVLASRLTDQHDVTVFEKARGPGGRMSTRRADPFAFDHGAQYFTAETDRFRDFLDSFLTTEIMTRRSVDIATIGGARISDKPKFIATPGMNGICKALAKTLDVHCQFHVQALSHSASGWTLEDKDGVRKGPFDWVISSAPSVQTSALFPETFRDRRSLDQAKMLGCFSLMLGFDTPLELPWTALKSGTPPIGWMAVNSAKPKRPTSPALLIQSDNEWAEAHLEDDPLEVSSALLAAASDIAGQDLSSASHRSLHRWRYAATAQPAGKPYLMDDDLQLAACGDWCLGGKVEAAFTSASALADRFVTSSGS